MASAAIAEETGAAPECKVEVTRDELPTPLDFLKAVYCNEGLPLNTRLRAAMAAAPFCHPKLTAVAVMNRDDMAAALENALRRVSEAPKVMKRSRCPKLNLFRITPSPSLMTIFAHDNKSRWRRF